MEGHQEIILPYSFEKYRKSIHLIETKENSKVVVINSPEFEESAATFSIKSGYFFESNVGVSEGISYFITQVLLRDLKKKHKGFIHKKIDSLDEYSVVLREEMRNNQVLNVVGQTWESLLELKEYDGEHQETFNQINLQYFPFFLKFFY